MRRARVPPTSTTVTTPTQQYATSKMRRPAVRWDHRKDKYMLLAIFAQMNIRSPDFKQLSDMLGSEQYSVESLRRRFKDLEQMATEVMEDRQERITESSPENTWDDDGTLVNESLRAQNSSPSSNISTPSRHSNQHNHQREPLEALSLNAAPAARRRRRNIKHRGPQSPPGGQAEAVLPGGAPPRVQTTTTSQRAVHTISEGIGGRSPPNGPAGGWAQGPWNEDGRIFKGRASNRPNRSISSRRFHYHDNPHITTVSVNNGPIHTRYFES